MQPTPHSSATPLKVTPLHRNFAAEVDLRIGEALGDAGTIAALKLLWQQYPVMIFRRQALEEEEQVRFSSLFGECIRIHRKDNVSPYQPEIVYFSTLRYANGRHVGAFAEGEELEWHTDQSYTPHPATGAILHGVEVPRNGGEMSWADQYGAYDLLPKDVQGAIEGKIGIYRYAKRLGIMNASELQGNETARAAAALPDGVHPLVLQHPVTKRKALYADPTVLMTIQGLSEAENQRIMPILFAAGGHPSLVYRHRTRNGDLMMWDNGCTMHRRDAIAPEQPRLMKRTTFRLSPVEHCVPR